MSLTIGKVKDVMSKMTEKNKIENPDWKQGIPPKPPHYHDINDIEDELEENDDEDLKDFLEKNPRDFHKDKDWGWRVKIV